VCIPAALFSGQRYPGLPSALVPSAFKENKPGNQTKQACASIVPLTARWSRKIGIKSVSWKQGNEVCLWVGVGVSHTTARALLNKGHEKVCREVFLFFPLHQQNSSWSRCNPRRRGSVSSWERPIPSAQCQPCWGLRPHHELRAFLKPL